MASYNENPFTKHDDYMTPNYAWDNIKQFIPKDKVIWEAFYGDGKSGEHLKSLGFEVIHKPIDFFENDLGDIIISNPPFSNTKLIIERLVMIDKPFILLMSQSKLFTQYFRQMLKKNLQLIIPKKRIQFVKLVDGKVPTNFKNSCNFDCLYYCYKMNLPNDIIYLE